VSGGAEEEGVYWRRLALKSIPSAIRIVDTGRGFSNSSGIDMKYKSNKKNDKTNKEEIQSVPFKDATHVFVRCEEGDAISGDVSFVLFGTTVRGYRLSSQGYSYLYYLVDQQVPTNNPNVLALISRHFSGGLDTISFVEPAHENYVFGKPVYKRSSGVSRSYAELRDLPSPKISGQHHLHFKILEILAAAGPVWFKEKRGEVLQMFEGIHDSMMSSVALWAASVDDATYELIANTGLFGAPTMRDFARLAKSISVRAKSMQNLIVRDLRQVFELDVLVNRIEGDLDWEKEKENRVKPRFAQVSPELVFSKAKALFTEARSIGRAPIRMEWDKFWANRWQWSASGSIHSQHPADAKYVYKDNLLRNKFITITAMPEVSEKHFLERLPSIEAWSSYKYEWGKLRAIYGTDMTSYVLAHHAFYNCEDVLPKMFPVGKDANDKIVSARVSAILKNKLPMCIDFEDFNSQHSISSMQAVIDAYYEVFSSGMSRSQRQAIQWTRKSLDINFINDFVGTGTRYQSHGTLLSGWRLTTFMNSVLNRVYTEVLCGDVLPYRGSLHNGDDVILGVDNFRIAQKCAQAADNYAIRLQPTKCAFASIAEFLRVDHVRGSRGQYLSRACATIAHSRIESRMSTDARDLIESMEMRFSDCYHRGMPVKFIANLRAMYYKRQARICGMTVSEMYAIKETHRVCGGVSTSMDSRVDVHIEPGVVRTGDLEIPALPGIQAFALEILKDLKLEISLPSLVKRVTKATYAAVLEKARDVTVSATSDSWYVVMRALFKAHSGTLRIANFGKAALTGLGLELLQKKARVNALTRMLNHSTRPLEVLRLVV
jgi:hypothetical protein